MTPPVANSNEELQIVLASKEYMLTMRAVSLLTDLESQVFENLTLGKVCTKFPTENYFEFPKSTKTIFAWDIETGAVLSKG